MNQPNTKLDIQPVTPLQDDEIDLLELWLPIWRGRWLIIVITALFAISAAAYSLTMPNIYRAEVLLAPVEEGGGGLSALASQYGGLAAMAGIDIGGGGGQSKTALATLNSRAFIERFLDRHQLLVPLMAGVWSKELGRSVIDPELYDEVAQRWIREVTPPQKAEPSAWEMYEAFSQILSVSDNKKSGLVTVAIEWHDPSQAQQWANWLVEDLNQHFKDQDVAEAQRAIGYLEDQLGKTSLVEMQQVFYQLIESQTKTQMLADVRDEYVFQVIDPAVVPEEKIKPKRAVIVVVGTLLGGMLSLFVVFVLNFSGKRKQRKTSAV